MRHICRNLAIVAVGLLTTACVQAEDYAFAGARATGMAGANAVSVKDATAQWHNPAAFGFMMEEPSPLDPLGLGERVWGLNLFGIGGGYTMTQDTGHYLNIITGIDFDNIDYFNSGNPRADQKNVRNLIAMSAALQGASQEGNAYYMTGNGGGSLRIGSFAVGVRVFGESVGYVDELDTTNLGLEQNNVGEFESDIADVIAGNTSYDPGSYSIRNFTQSQQTQITDALGLSDPETLKYLDFELGRLLAGGTLKSPDIGNVAELMSSLSFGPGNSIDNNQTVISARGFGLVEVPISYGKSINETYSIGFTAKLMFGRVMGTKVWLFDEDSLDYAVDNVTKTKNDSVSLGIDIGALYRIPFFQFAMVGHNLNRPVFEGYTDTVIVNGREVTIVVPDVKLDPQITVGAAFIPSRHFVLEVNYETLKTGTLLDGYDMQRLSVGSELDLGFLALRLGGYKNLAESWQAVVGTAGVGINLFGFRVDVGGAYSLGDSVQFEENQIPPEARFFAEIGLDY